MTLLWHKVLVFALAAAWCGEALAQQRGILPSLYGEALLDALVVHFEPESTPSWNEARQRPFGEIYYEDGVVRCVFTDRRARIDRKSDVAYYTQAFQKGKLETEHTWARSTGTRMTTSTRSTPSSP